MHFDDLDALLEHRKLRKSEIGHVLHHRFHHPASVGAVHLQLHARKLGLVFGEDLGQHVNTGGFVGRDDEFPARRGLEFIQRILRLTPNVEHPLGIFREDLSRGSQRNTAAKALKQLGFQFVFELADLGADGWLRPITGLRGLREALKADDLEKRVELVKIHTLTALVTGREDGGRTVLVDFPRILSEPVVSSAHGPLQLNNP